MKAGGVPVLAHPAAHGRWRTMGEPVLRELVDAGLAGLEVDHRDNTEDGRRWLREIADRYDLIVTGASDYHGTGKPNRLAEHTTDPEAFERIMGLGTGSTVRRG